jgi:hypothetical protein
MPPCDAPLLSTLTHWRPGSQNQASSIPINLASIGGAMVSRTVSYGGCGLLDHLKENARLPHWRPDEIAGKLRKHLDTSS